MQPVLRDHHPELVIEEVARNCGDETINQSEHMNEAAELSMPTPPYAALMMPASRAAHMAVLDENGYLVPVFTAAELLRSFRYFWRASQD